MSKSKQAADKVTVNSFKFYKSAGMYSIIPAMQQNGISATIPTLVKQFRVSYYMQYIPTAWFIIIISLTWIGSMALFSILVIKQGAFYFNSTGMHACEPFYPKASLRILAACGFYFPTTMILMYCYGSAFDVNKLGFKRTTVECSAVMTSSMEVEQSSSIEKFLRVLKFFPEENEEDSWNYLIKFFFMYIAVAVYFCFVLCYFIVGVKNHFDIDILKFSVVCIVSFIGVAWINICCFKNRHLLIQLGQAVSDFTTFEKPPGFAKFNQEMNFYSKLHLLYLSIGCLLYFSVFAPLRMHKCEKLNERKHLSELCSLIVPMYIPLIKYENLGKYPTVYVIDMIEFIILLHTYMTCGSILWINFEMIEYIRFRIRHLKSLLVSGLEETNKLSQKALIHQALKYHEEILRMGRLANKFFGTELFLHVILTGAIVGVTAFQMIDTQSLDLVMLFVGWVNAIIMGCVSGQRLINESLTIPDILYLVDWHELDIDIQKDLLLFLLRSKIPMHIKAGNVIMTNQLIIEV
ncbi:unnamed protein product [Ceutorhynchus assimilis]|uniref:Uncharacterized protein n=1 Tax=Ceutorhynchus assimilis TaxID=467358 RepID=A0A9N9MLM8_9CUCU|nr:unnamed protein product [Ceutorhynchus assimilis]